MHGGSILYGGSICSLGYFPYNQWSTTGPSKAVVCAICLWESAYKGPLLSFHNMTPLIWSTALYMTLSFPHHDMTLLIWFTVFYMTLSFPHHDMTLLIWSTALDMTLSFPLHSMTMLTWSTILCMTLSFPLHSMTASIWPSALHDLVIEVGK